MRMTIKIKLIGGFGAVLLLAAVTGGVGYVKLNAADEAIAFIASRSECRASSSTRRRRRFAASRTSGRW